MLHLFRVVLIASLFAVSDGFLAPVQRSPLKNIERPYVIPTLRMGDDTTALDTGGNGIELEEYEEYSRCLSSREERKLIMKEDEEYAIVDQRPAWQRALLYPFTLGRRAMPKKVTKPGALILVRCGESEWNVNQTFTGW